MVEQEKIAFKAYPLGFCAGVAWAIRNAEDVLAKHSKVIGLGNLVNNIPVVRRLEEKGMTFVDEIEEIPRDSVVMISAHGLSTSELQELRKRRALMIDSTCPLVKAVHTRVKKAIETARVAGRKARILYICKPDFDHREVRGVLGEAPNIIIPLTSREEVEAFKPENGSMHFVDTQTTFNYANASELITILKRKIPDLRVPPNGDVCSATQNRQGALRKVLENQLDMLITFGSGISSNTAELVKLGKAHGLSPEALPLLESADQVTEELIGGRFRIGVTAGASQDPIEADRCLDQLAGWGYQVKKIFFGKPEPSYFSIAPRVEDSRQA